MKMSTKSAITISLIISIIISLSPIYIYANNKCIDTNECFQKHKVFGDISNVNNTKDNSASIGDEEELDWYYVSKGKNQIPEGPNESIDFLKENSAYYLGDTSKKVLYLTFDEGYENNNTPQILNILKEFKIPAAFFVTKPFIDNHPELVKRMVAEGHIVGNHGVHHTSIAKIHDKEALASELNGVADSYKKLIGEDIPKFFRPPMWKYSKKSLQMTKDLGYKTTFSSFAFKDWLKDQFPESYVIEKILLELILVL